MTCHYSMLIHWSDEDQVYVVTLPEFGGCMTHGDTYEKAARQGQDALESLVEAYQAEGRPLPAPQLFIFPAPEETPARAWRGAWGDASSRLTAERTMAYEIRLHGDAAAELRRLGVFERRRIVDEINSQLRSGFKTPVVQAARLLFLQASRLHHGFETASKPSADRGDAEPKMSSRSDGRL